LINLSDQKKAMKDLIIEKIKSKYPQIDISPGSAFLDFFINPTIELKEEQLKRIERAERLQVFDDPGSLDERDVDLFIENNYPGITRRQGNKASGEIIFYFRAIPETEDLVIPIGAVVSKDNDTRYLVIGGNEFSQSSLPEYYNTDSFMYEIPVIIEAENVGSRYNVEAEEIKTLETEIFGAVNAENKASFENGTDRETNEELVERAKNYYLGIHLGSSDGYKGYVLENFDDVKDVFVVGFGDEMMSRDVIGEEHYGGKVDLYIHGSDAKIETEVFTIAPSETVFELDKKPLVVINSVTNLTNSEQEVSYNILYDDELVKGSIREECSIEITGGAVDDDEVEVVYVYDSLINKIHDDLYLEKNRIITADVLPRLSDPAYVYVKFDIELVENRSFGSLEKSYVNNVLNEYINGMSLGGTIHESEIVSRLYKNANVSQFLKRIPLPFQALYSSSEQEGSITLSHNTKIDLAQNEHPVLYKYEIEAITE